MLTVVSKDNPEAAGFSEKSCIYINSGTYDSYIPMYNDESVDETFSYTPIDNDTLLNYKGLLKPSESYDVDLTGINKIETTAYGGFEMIVTDLEGNEYDGLDREVVFGGNWLSKITFHKAKRYQINSFGNSETFDTEIKGEDCLFRVNLVTEDKSPISLDYTDEKTVLEVLYGKTEYELYYLYNEGEIPTLNRERAVFIGETDTDIKVTKSPEGFILDGTNGVSRVVEFSDFGYDKNGYKSVFNDRVTDLINTQNPVLVSLDEKENICYYIGENFDEKVVKGDVDCDGKITAYDAACILSAYATSSSGGEKSYIGNVLGDMDDDSKITASDASAVLAEYSKIHE